MPTPDMPTPFSKVVFALVSLAVVAACDTGTAPDPFLPRKGVEIVVDSAVYHLQPRQPGFYRVNLAVTVINGSDHDVYLAQYCGHWALRRADDNQSRLELGAYACFAPGGTSRPAPLLIEAGTRYPRTFDLRGSLQPQARPQITLDDNIGVLRFHYAFTNPSGTAAVSIASQPFRVLPPA